MSKVIIFACLLFAILLNSNANATNVSEALKANTAINQWCVEQSFSSIPDKMIQSFCLNVMDDSRVFYYDVDGFLSITDEYTSAFKLLNDYALDSMYIYVHDYLYLNK